MNVKRLANCQGLPRSSRLAFSIGFLLTGACALMVDPSVTHVPGSADCGKMLMVACSGGWVAFILALSVTRILIPLFRRGTPINHKQAFHCLPPHAQVMPRPGAIMAAPSAFMEAPPRPRDEDPEDDD